MTAGTSTIYNTTDGPLVITAEGGIIAGRSRLSDVDVDSELVKPLVAAGLLLVLEAPASAAQAGDEPAKPKVPRPRSTNQEG